MGSLGQRWAHEQNPLPFPLSLPAAPHADIHRHSCASATTGEISAPAEDGSAVAFLAKPPSVPVAGGSYVLICFSSLSANSTYEMVVVFVIF